MDLANRLGCTVADVKSRVSWVEFLDWRAFTEIEAERARKIDKMDYHFAHLCWLVTAIVQGSDAAGDIEDHMLNFEPATQLSQEEHARAVELKLRFALSMAAPAAK